MKWALHEEGAPLRGSAPDGVVLLHRRRRTPALRSVHRVEGDQHKPLRRHSVEWDDVVAADHEPSPEGNKPHWSACQYGFERLRISKLRNLYDGVRRWWPLRSEASGCRGAQYGADAECRNDHAVTCLHVGAPTECAQ